MFVSTQKDVWDTLSVRLAYVTVTVTVDSEQPSVIPCKHSGTY